MVFRVIVPKQRRAFEIGRHPIQFIYQSPAALSKTHQADWQKVRILWRKRFMSEAPPPNFICDREIARANARRKMHVAENSLDSGLCVC